MVNNSQVKEFGTKEYFRWEVLNFRKLMSDKKFWEDDEKVCIAFEALITVWLKTEDAEPRDEILIQATADEFKWRYQMMSCVTHKER